jgi:hypothetical protein
VRALPWFPVVQGIPVNQGKLCIDGVMNCSGMPHPDVPLPSCHLFSLLATCLHTTCLPRRLSPTG